MNRNHQILLSVIMLVALLAGCMTVPQGDAVHVALYGEENNSTGDTALNPITYSQSGFRIEGELVAEGGAPDRETYRDVSILLYDENSTFICATPLGDWNSDDSIGVEVATDEVPYYVVLYSPDFWEESMSVEYFMRSDERHEFVPHDAPSVDELPVDVDTDTDRACA